MQLENLKFILEVYKTKNITLAAKNMYTSQPHLSNGVKQIEEHIGVKIFTRSRHGTFPTDIGYKVIEQIQKIVSNIENLEYRYDKNSLKDLTASLSISTIPTLSMSLLPRSISNFKKDYPKINFKIEEEHSWDIIDKVRNSTSDIGFIAISNHKIHEDNISYTYIMSTKIQACVSTRNPLAHKQSVNLNDIIQYPILSSSSFVINHLREQGNPTFLFNSKELEGAKRAISEDLAIGFYTDLYLQFDPYVSTQQIIPIDIKESSFNLSLYIIERKQTNRILTEKFKEYFIKQLKLYYDS